MGVKALWDLLRACARPLAIESDLHGQTLAVDMSIWLMQLVKGMRDSNGDPLADAHLAGLFVRVCALLFHGVKPVFVFDGGAPALKQDTIAQRRRQHRAGEDHLANARAQLLHNALRRHALSVLEGTAVVDVAALLPRRRHARGRDLYELPAAAVSARTSRSGKGVDIGGYVSNSAEEDDEEDDDDDARPEVVLDTDGTAATLNRWHFDSHEVDLESTDFAALPLEIQYEVLMDLREKNKHKSRSGPILHGSSAHFSSLQIDGVIMRNVLSKKIDAVRVRMLENESEDGVRVHRIMGNGATVYLLEKWDAVAPLAVDAPDLPSAEEISGELPVADPARLACALKLLHRRRELHQQQQQQQSVTGRGSQGVPNNANEAESESHSECENSPSFPSDAGDWLAELQAVDMPKEAVLDAVEDKIVACSASSSALHPLNEVLSQPTWTLTESVGNFHTREMEVRVTSEPETFVTHVTCPVPSSPIRKNSYEFFDDDLPAKKEAVAPSETLLPLLAVLSDTQRNSEHFSGKKEIFEMPQSTLEPTVVSVLAAVPCLPENNVLPSEHTAARTTEWAPTLSPLLPTLFSPSPSTSNMALLSSASVAHVLVPTHAPVATQARLATESGALITHAPVATQATLATESGALTAQAARLARSTADVSHEMLLEAQELLRLFGVPFCIAPMEAEAQCAFLELAGLTSGTITDDGDIFLFGGTTVYRHLFSKSHDPQAYHARDIQATLGLDRSKLIELAYLLGCDYTPGISGVGIVLAMEILADFPDPEKLFNFAKWLQRAFNDKASGKKSGAEKSVGQSKVRTHLLQMKTPLSLPAGFPDARVADAFQSPTVDTSTEPFAWSVPDVAGLRDFALNKLRWTAEKFEKYLNPVMDRLARPSAAPVQRTMDAFVTRTHAAPPREGVTSRLAAARDKLLGAAAPPPPKRRAPSTSQRGAAGSGAASGAAAPSEVGKESAMAAVTRKRAAQNSAVGEGVAAKRSRQRRTAPVTGAVDAARPAAATATTASAEWAPIAGRAGAGHSRQRQPRRGDTLSGFQMWLVHAFPTLGAVSPSEAWAALGALAHRTWQMRARTAGHGEQHGGTDDAAVDAGESAAV